MSPVSNSKTKLQILPPASQKEGALLRSRIIILTSFPTIYGPLPCQDRKSRSDQRRAPDKEPRFVIGQASSGFREPQTATTNELVLFCPIINTSLGTLRFCHWLVKGLFRSYLLSIPYHRGDWSRRRVVEISGCRIGGENLFLSENLAQACM